MSTGPQDKTPAGGEPEDAGTSDVEVAAESAGESATEAKEAAAEAKEAAATAKRAASRTKRAAAALAEAAAEAEAAMEPEAPAEADAEPEGEPEAGGAAPAEAEPKPKPARRRAAASGDDKPEAAPAAGKKAQAAKTGGKAKAKPAAEGGKPASLDDLPADIFDAKVNIALMHQVVVAQQAAARQGTHATKTRGDVRGGGKKPYRQKGTGRARQGSVRAPQFAGGGTVHGPVPRSYAQRTPKKMKAAALRGALSDRARHGLVYVVDGLVDGDQPKTSAALAALTSAAGTRSRSGSLLVVAESSDTLTWKSLRNAPGVHLIAPGQLNTYDVLVSDRVVFTRTALDAFVARAGTTAASAESEER